MQLAAVSLERHAKRAWQRYTNYSFAAQDHLVPLLAAELSSALPQMPLAFVPVDGRYLLVAVTALTPGQNHYVAPNGQWLAAYVPAALRGYPFRLIKPADQGPDADAVLCVIEDSGLLVDPAAAAPAGAEAFFDADGQPSAALRAVLDFLTQIERNRRATETAVAALAAAGLIQPWALSTTRDGATLPVEGLFRIDEAALNQLDAEALLDLRNRGGLAIAYAQLLAMGQFKVLERLQATQAEWRAQQSAQATPASVPAGLPVSAKGELDLEFLNDGGSIRFGNLG